MSTPTTTQFVQFVNLMIFLCGDLDGIEQERKRIVASEVLSRNYILPCPPLVLYLAPDHHLIILLLSLCLSPAVRG